jgi:two-component sensor histidine kinase
VLSAEIAMPLAMVLNELLLNAVEHGFAPGSDGEVTVSVHKFRRQLHVSVADDGKGLPDDFDFEAGERLGLQIVRTLARGELRGTIEMRTRAGGGTEAMLVVPLGARR